MECATVTLSYPSNIPGLHGHNWANGIAMPSAQCTEGQHRRAKVKALALLDLFHPTPKLVADAWDYFTNVQTKTIKYKSFLGPNDGPPTWLNAGLSWRGTGRDAQVLLRPLKYKTYLEQQASRIHREGRAAAHNPSLHRTAMMTIRSSCVRPCLAVAMMCRFPAASLQQAKKAAAPKPDHDSRSARPRHCKVDEARDDATDHRRCTRSANWACRS
ncbi:MAG: hypothetical protein U0163_13530 [Gemmatimonadaceae bacterium]